MSKWTPRLPEAPAEYTPWPWRRLGALAIVMLLVVAGVTVAFTLPAERGTDPTGIGAWLRLDELNTPPTRSEPAPIPVPENVTELLHFEYDWESSNSLVADETGSLSEGAETTITVPVQQQNVTKIAAILTWQDSTAAGEPQPDTFTISLDGPAGRGDAQGANEGANGHIETNVTAAIVPPAGNVTAADQAAALAAILERHPGRTDATGEWTITIRLDDVADALGDEGNEWRLQVFVETYSLVLGASSATPIREATVSVDLPAFGQWVEYKVFMAEGRTLEYTWSATNTVTYDLHGVRSSGEETSHETGAADQAEGRLLVPFSGQHGWAWKHDGPTETTITLTIRGPFVLP